jgi:hypothetical protein
MTRHFALATYVAAAVRRHPTVWSVAAWTGEAKIHLAIFMICVGLESQADNESIGIGDQLSHLFGADVKVIEGYVILHSRYTRPSELGDLYVRRLAAEVCHPWTSLVIVTPLTEDLRACG